MGIIIFITDVLAMKCKMEGVLTCMNESCHTTSITTDVKMQYSLAVMSHAFPVVKRENTAVNSKDH